jgi:hypothetical protein
MVSAAQQVEQAARDLITSQIIKKQHNVLMKKAKHTPGCRCMG